MARNKSRDKLIQAFLSRNRRDTGRMPGAGTTPRAPSSAPAAFRPVKQSAAPPYRATKRRSRYERY